MVKLRAAVNATGLEQWSAMYTTLLGLCLIMSLHCCFSSKSTAYMIYHLLVTDLPASDFEVGADLLSVIISSLILITV